MTQPACDLRSTRAARIALPRKTGIAAQIVRREGSAGMVSAGIGPVRRASARSPWELCPAKGEREVNLGMCLCEGRARTCRSAIASRGTNPLVAIAEVPGGPARDARRGRGGSGAPLEKHLLIASWLYAGRLVSSCVGYVSFNIRVRERLPGALPHEPHSSLERSAARRPSARAHRRTGGTGMFRRAPNGLKTSRRSPD